MSHLPLFQQIVMSQGHHVYSANRLILVYICHVTQWLKMERRGLKMHTCNKIKIFYNATISFFFQINANSFVVSSRRGNCSKRKL